MRRSERSSPRTRPSWRARRLRRARVVSPPTHPSGAARRSGRARRSARGGEAPNVCGPASNRISRWPRSWSARRATRGSISSPTSAASPRLLPGRGRGAVPHRASTSGSPRARRAPGGVRRSPRCRSGSQARGARPSAKAAELSEQRSRVGMGAGGRPRARRRAAERAGADDDDIGERPEQAHDEAVGLAAAADQLVRLRDLGQGRPSRRARRRSSCRPSGRRSRARRRTAAQRRRQLGSAAAGES